MVFDELADTRCAVDVRNDLEEKVRRGKRGFDLRQIGLAMLVAHCPGGDAKGPIVQSSDQGIDLSSQRRFCQFFRKAPEFTAAGDRPLVIKEHAVGVTASPARKETGITCPLSV